MRLTTFLIAFSLMGCAHIISNPDSNLYIVQAPDKKIRGYNLKRDYDSDGNRKPDAKPIEYHVERIEQLDKWACSDPVSFERMQTAARDVRDYVKNNCTCK